jgi:hypothetical protein
LNTCASSHMTFNRNISISLDATKQIDLEVAEGTIIRSVGRGTISVPIGNGKLKLTDVHYVPQISANLISVSQLEMRGLAFSIQSGGAVSITRNGTKVGAGRCHGHLYILEHCFKVEGSRAFAVRQRPLQTSREHDLSTEEYSRLFHRRLGHVGRPKTTSLHKCVDGLREPL